MATQSAKDIRRWQPRRLERTGLFLISINPAWLLNELSSKRATAKRKPLTLTLPYNSLGIETRESNVLSALLHKYIVSTVSKIYSA